MGVDMGNEVEGNGGSDGRVMGLDVGGEVEGGAWVVSDRIK